LRIDRALSAVRGGLGLAILVAWWLTLGPRGVTPVLLLVPGALFVVAVIVHDAVVRRRHVAERAVAFYDRGLARLEDRWVGGGEMGARFRDDTHPYAADLDLFGRASLFELLCTARTRVGQETLARWLRVPASAREVVRVKQRWPNCGWPSTCAKTWPWWATTSSPRCLPTRSSDGAPRLPRPFPGTRVPSRPFSPS
jgi:hypothetical protein